VISRYYITVSICSLCSQLRKIIVESSWLLIGWTIGPHQLPNSLPNPTFASFQLVVSICVELPKFPNSIRFDSPRGNTTTVWCLAWTADGKTLISGSGDRSIRMWDTTGTWQQIAVLTGHTNEVYGITISPNGRILASASRDKSARLWNLENGQPIGSPLRHTRAVECPSFSTDGKQLATGCRDNDAYTWNISAIVEDAGLSELLNPSVSWLTISHPSTN
jgi:WD40 repeat protein